jgi:hypothetical protein
MTAIPISTPIVNAGTMYINGLQLSWESITQVNVFPGAARNFSDVNFDATNANYTNEADIVLPVLPYTTQYNGNLPAIVINAALQGAGGLDIGALVADTLYAVYVIGDSYGINPTSAILSLSFDAPSLPGEVQGGYDMYRRIGAVLTDGGGHILPFYQTTNVNGTDRTMYYDAQIPVLTAGTSAAYAAVSLAAFMPAQATNVTLEVELTPTAAGDAINFRPTGSTSVFGYAAMSGDVTAQEHIDTIVIPISALGSFDYKVVGSATLNLTSYVDLL